MIRVCVLGEAVTDRYFVGTSTRLSPEAPVPVVTVTDRFDLKGGAANVHENLRALGCASTLISQPGPWPIKNRLFMGDRQLARWDEADTCAELDAATLRYHQATLYDLDGLVLSDYCKGMFTLRAMQLLQDKLPPVPLFIDTKQNPAKFAFLSHNAFFFPNMREYLAYQDIYDSLPSVIRTEGPKGLSYLQGGEVLHTFPAYASHVRSVIGAGDSVVAAFASEYLRQSADCATADLASVLDFVCRYAAVVVQKPYTSTATPTEAHEA